MTIKEIRQFNSLLPEVFDKGTICITKFKPHDEENSECRLIPASALPMNWAAQTQIPLDDFIIMTLHNDTVCWHNISRKEMVSILGYVPSEQA